MLIEPGGFEGPSGADAKLGNAWPRPSGDFLEPSRSEAPLRLLAEYSAAAPGSWHPLVLDEDRRCFSLHWPQAISAEKSQDFFLKLLAVAPWVELLNTKGTSVTRSTCWFSSGGCTCDYAYGRETRVTNADVMNAADGRAQVEDMTGSDQFIHGSVEAEPLSDESLSGFKAAMEEIMQHVFGDLFPGLEKEAWPNSANINLYRDGRQGVGWHADDESLFCGKDSDCPVVSISLGATREFWIALKNGADPVTGSIVETDLCDGDILTMEGRMQRHCLHFVPKCNPREPIRHERINITFRWVRAHRSRCPLRRRRRTALPATLRAILGEGQSLGTAGDLAERCRLNPLPLRLDTYVRCWSFEVAQGILADSTNIQLRSCDGCKHVCYADGRPCCEGHEEWSGNWFCRRCWSRWEPAAFMALPPSLPAVLGDFALPQMLEGISDWEGVQTWWPAPYSPYSDSPYSENMMPDMTSCYPLPAQPFAAADWMTMPDAASCAGLAEGKYAVPKPFNLWQTSTDAFGQPGTQALRKAGGGIFQEAQLHDVPSTLPAGSGLALFADGTVPAREEASLTGGGRWLLGLRRSAEDFVPLLNEVWFALTSGLLRSHFEGHADVCGVAVSLTAADAKVALWLKHAEEELHVLAVGQVLLDMLLAVEEKVSGVGAADIRIKFEDFQRGRVTQKLRGA